MQKRNLKKKRKRLELEIGTAIIQCNHNSNGDNVDYQIYSFDNDLN